jgi:hypothetical protein
MSDWSKFQIGFDIHGDEQDHSTCESFFEFQKVWKPDIKILGGDLWDLRPLRKKASDEEKRESMRNDFDMGMEWLKRFEPDFFLRGNHDERLWELAEADCGPRSDLAIIGIEKIEKEIKKMKCRMLPYHKSKGVLRIGHLKVLHGFFCGVYAARQHALVYGSCLFGHVHDITEHSIPGIERRVARCGGALCHLDLDYAARTPNTMRQANGWPYGIINKKNGNYFCWQAEKIGGKFMIPSDIVEL